MENGRALAERLQWHENCMTPSGEQSNKNDARAGFREWWLALSVSLGTALLVIAPFFWLVNAYALVIVYMRSDFAEQLACALLPLLVLTTLQLCGVVESRRRLWPRSMGFFAVAFAAVWLSNAPAAVVANYSVALIFAWAVFEKKSLRPLWRGAGGLALGFGLAGFYLLPAAYEQRWVNISQALSSGLQPADNFLYTTISDPEHNAFNWIASSVAVLLLGGSGVPAVVARPASRRHAQRALPTNTWQGVL